LKANGSNPPPFSLSLPFPFRSFSFLIFKSHLLLQRIYTYVSVRPYSISNGVLVRRKNRECIRKKGDENSKIQKKKRKGGICKKKNRSLGRERPVRVKRKRGESSGAGGGGEKNLFFFFHFSQGISEFHFFFFRFP
jgi:hypothetical protein